MYDEFFGIEESEQYAFYRVPKLLFTSDRFWNLSTDAKMLYGLLLDRMALSQKNGWVDEQGRVYIIYTVENIMQSLGCGNKKAIQLLAELENKANLILRKKQGLGKPNLIYVKKFTVVARAVERHFLKCENDTSGNFQTTTLGVSKEHGNNTDKNNTEFSDTDSIFPSGNGGMMDENDRYQEYFDYFSDQLSMDLLKKDYPYDSEMLDNILELIVETVCTKRPLIRIGAEERPAEIVRSRFMKLNGKKFTCADCGSVMKLVRSFSTKKDKVYFTFKCPTYAEHGTRACNAKKMRKADLDEAVLSAIQAQLDLFVDMQDSLHQLLAMKKAIAKQNGQKDEIKSLKKKLDQKKGLFGGLYRDLREGLISDEDYAQTREVILGEIKRLEKQLAELEGTTNRFEEQLRGEKKWAELVKKYHNATEVTAEMVDAMIVSMKMNEDSSLSIEFNHMDEFKAIYDTIDILRKEVA